MRPLLVLLALLSLPAAAISAEADIVTWRGLAISIDPDEWQTRISPHGETLTLTCIAPDCGGEPSVYAIANAISSAAGVDRHICTAGDRNWRRALPLGETPVGPIGLSADSRWSGCRAMDTPILEACGELGGLLYRLTTRVGEGCNFAPRLPESRFLSLLRRIGPAR